MLRTLGSREVGCQPAQLSSTGALLQVRIWRFRDKVTFGLWARRVRTRTQGPRLPDQYSHPTSLQNKGSRKAEVLVCSGSWGKCLSPGPVPFHPSSLLPPPVEGGFCFSSFCRHFLSAVIGAPRISQLCPSGLSPAHRGP